MDIDSKFRDSSINIPSPKEISEGNKDTVSPILTGRMYEITKYNDENRNKWAVKTLRPEIEGSVLYPSQNLDKIFEDHISEHQLFVECFGNMVEPAEFFIEITPDGKKQYCSVQPWIEDGVQYKEAVKNGRKLSESQFPDLDQRISFITGLAKLLEHTDGKLPDLDFFISRDNGQTRIRIFDTTGFWFEKRGGKDRNEMINNLKNFLFNERDLSDPRVSEIFQKLTVPFDYFS